MPARRQVIVWSWGLQSGPFVGDDEVEKIVNHLKLQGVPEYLDAITEEDEQNRLRDYKRQAVAATSTVGDAIKQHKLDENR